MVNPDAADSGGTAVGRLLAHSRSKSGRIDTVADHLKSVADTAARFAEAFGAADEARLAGESRRPAATTGRSPVRTQDRLSVAFPKAG